MTMQTDDVRLTSFARYLYENEKSRATSEKYLRDVRGFFLFNAGATDVEKQTVLAYKTYLAEHGYAVSSANSMLASLNAYLRFIGREDCIVRKFRTQKTVFCPKKRELTRHDYERLCTAAKNKQNERLYLILQTICGTGIRVSELPFITVDAVRNGEAIVSLKGKTRRVFLVRDLQKKLLRYIAVQGMVSGAVFVTRTGKPICRTNIWREMKTLCADAGVSPEKVFPHNLRHLFARMFYEVRKDIAKLADILGHSNINTTRIYIVSSGQEHRRMMERMHLIC